MGTYQAFVLDGLETLLPNAESRRTGGAIILPAAQLRCRVLRLTRQAGVLRGASCCSHGNLLAVRTQIVVLLHVVFLGQSEHPVWETYGSVSIDQMVSV